MANKKVPNIPVLMYVFIIYMVAIGLLIAEYQALRLGKVSYEDTDITQQTMECLSHTKHHELCGR